MNVKKTMTAMILRHHFVSRDNAKNASIRERSVIDLPSQDFAKKMIMFEVDVQYLVIYVVNREKTNNKMIVSIPAKGAKILSNGKNLKCIVERTTRFVRVANNHAQSSG